ncbi:carbamoyl-phosphate synthase L chain, ATP binding domain-containing protein [Cladochytrium replicatum]|nr:carbamoyl-phosphate synthase L chain, ATP binding domain-containing protein [Cladochytrium replicatum]
MFDKILVANRGEIAVRVMKTAKKMGIKTVAIYSDADANSMHVQMADEAVNVGPPPTNQSYLVMPNILNAIKKTGAQAVHPGYGFLSENFHFVKALDELGISFIGPNEYAMHAMGDKIESKIIAKEAGVSTIPGFNGVCADADHAVKIARDIGYPVMVKASAGGGGKGMRIAYTDAEVKDAFRLSAAEAKSSFGDDRLLVEKFIEHPRHIEIQLIGDQHGNVYYLPERECSIQRRNQKVIEEAPSPHIDPATRKAMGEQAVALARRVGYYSAGTCEFLVDPQRNFYFLEMNTRLQVEHPITEYITGLDLVECMIRVAAGEKLKLSQDSVAVPHGWAFESRVYAEDPEKYLPSIGRLSKYIEPHGVAHEVRCDSGVREGSDISVYYDPLICKLCTNGSDRVEAMNNMSKALDSYVIKGVTHNIPLLHDVINHPRFRAGKLSTGFLKEEYPNGFKGHALTEPELRELASLAAYIHARRELRNREWKAGGGAFAEKASSTKCWEFAVGVKGYDESVKVGVSLVNECTYQVTIDGETSTVTSDWALETPLLHAQLSSLSTPTTIQYLAAQPLGYKLQFHGTQYDVTVQTPSQAVLSKYMKPKATLDLSNSIVSPMPGTVVSVSVKAGDVVAEGSEVAVVEAMKMQNVLRAPRVGKVAKVLVAQGANVQADEVRNE